VGFIEPYLRLLKKKIGGNSKMDIKLMELFQEAITKLYENIDKQYESMKEMVLEIQALRLQNATQRIINQYLLEMCVHDNRESAQELINRIRELNKE